MCGTAGIFKVGRPVDVEMVLAVLRMVDRQVHAGPKDWGILLPDEAARNGDVCVLPEASGWKDEQTDPGSRRAAAALGYPGRRRWGRPAASASALGRARSYAPSKVSGLHLGQKSVAPVQRLGSLRNTRGRQWARFRPPGSSCVRDPGYGGCCDGSDRRPAGRQSRKAHGPLSPASSPATRARLAVPSDRRLNTVESADQTDGLRGDREPMAAARRSGL